MLTDKEYVDRSGIICPYCNSIEVKSGCLDINGKTVTDNIICLDCNKEWTDIYTLIGFEVVD